MVKNNGRSLPVEQHNELDDQDKPVWVPARLWQHDGRRELRRSGAQDCRRSQRIGGQAHQHFLERTCVELVENGKKYCQKWRDTRPKWILRAFGPARSILHPDQFRSGSHSFRHDRIDTTVAAMRRQPTTLRAVWARASPFGSTRPRSRFLPSPTTRGSHPDAVVAELGSRWTIGVAPNDSETMRSSLSSTASTRRKADPVELVASEIPSSFERSCPEDRRVPAAQIKSQLFVFVNCLVENPAFSSQTKEELTTHSRDFGSSPTGRPKKERSSSIALPRAQ